MEECENAEEPKSMLEAAMDAETLVAEAKSSLTGLSLCLDLYDEALQSGDGLDLFAVLHFNSMQADVLERAIGKMDEACLRLEGFSEPDIFDED